MEELLVHLFLIAPMIKWLTNQSRPWNRKSVYPGVALAVIALAGIGASEVRREESNFYELLGLSTSASKAEVQASYRRLAVRLHPDKNPEPNAKELFANIKQAHEVLCSEEHRKTYTRFGDYSKAGDVSAQYFWDVLFVTIIQCFIPLFFGYIYTFGKQSAAARKVFLCYVSLTFCLEILLRFGPHAETQLRWLPGIGELLPFEKVKALHSLIPSVLNGVLLLGGKLHADFQAAMDQLVTATLRANLHLVDKMDKLLLQVKGSSDRKSLSRSASKQDADSPFSRPADMETSSCTKNGMKNDDGRAGESGREGVESGVTDGTKIAGEVGKIRGSSEGAVSVDGQTRADDDLRANHTTEEDSSEPEWLWWRDVQSYDEGLRQRAPPGLALSSFISSLKDCREPDWHSKRGQQLPAFITMKKNAGDRAVVVTFASVAFFAFMFLKHFGLSFLTGSSSPSTTSSKQRNPNAR